MSQYALSPPQKPAPQPYPPTAYQNAASPTNPSGYGPPPAKRPRLSPDARSPAGSAPPYAQPLYGGSGVYGNPYAQQTAVQSPYGSPSTYVASPQSSFNTPHYHPQWQSQAPSPASAPTRQMSPPNPQTTSAQMMPPPPRPNKEEKEQRMNIDDIGDSLYGSGVSIKDEENYLLNAFQNRHGNDSFASTQGTSFGSSTMSANNSFNLLTQGTSFGSQGPNGAFAGRLGHTHSQEEIEAEAKRKRANAARARNEANQYPMNNQFLLTNCVRSRLMDRAKEQGVAVNTQGLWQRAQGTQVMLNGSGTEGIAAVDTRPEFTTTRGDHFEQLLSLVSLASDIAVVEGERRVEEVVPENITSSQWDRVPGTDDTNLANGSSTTPQPQPTISFHSAITTRLRDLALRDEAAETARTKSRETRRKAAEAAAAGTSTDENGNAAADSGAESSGMAPIAEPAKISKKEQLRKEKEAKNANQAFSHTSTNQTAAKFTLGKKAKQYSWMQSAGSAGGAAGLQNRYKAAAPAAAAASTAVGPGTNTLGGVAGKVEGSGASPGAVGSSGAVGDVAMARGASDQGPAKPLEWGEWREDGPEGQGVQGRDWVVVLERDAKQKMALQRLFTKLT
ncbi:hypothetical protein LTR91_004190 [Friedmanniomyces endolithicus]|uniref:TBP-associated factor 4 n=1 Tax=Friedmanniomyces endolithicus TaxID=329885 RepID=A0AAN6KW91_9PEZI|nr:hypothetical protein LTR57_005297 [Friedmanniomyces endolithicus]KAK1004695.1 hypothetical protein LTR91_004190 [Friedmanniomyces endolithicus]KAK1045853.1 hypothetical protein LTS16_006279 [Friedmanniomyces endolithicus]